MGLVGSSTKLIPTAAEINYTTTMRALYQPAGNAPQAGGMLASKDTSTDTSQVEVGCVKRKEPVTLQGNTCTPPVYSGISYSY